LPRPYALLKLLFLPFSLVVHGTEHDVRPEPSILALLSAGRVGEACRIAVRRLRASGLTPLPHARGRSRDREWEELSQSGVDGRRLAAALLLPLSEGAVKRLVKLVVRPPKAEQQLFPVVQETEDQDD
jgi:CRISPR-associated protein Csx17